MIRQLCQLLQLQPVIHGATKTCAAVSCGSIYLLDSHPVPGISLKAVWKYHSSQSTSREVRDGEVTLQTPAEVAEPDAAATADQGSTGIVQHAGSHHSHSTSTENRNLVKPEDAQPVLLTYKILKTVMTSSKPPTSHELFLAVQEQYPGDFKSRTFFKQHLRALQKKKLVGVSNQVTLGIGKKGDPFVFLPSQSAQRVDLNEGGSKLQVQARALADRWTLQKLPQYAEHVKAGRVPLTVDNQGLVEEPVRQQLRLKTSDRWRGFLQQQQQQQRQQQDHKQNTGLPQEQMQALRPSYSQQLRKKR